MTGRLAKLRLGDPVVLLHQCQNRVAAGAHDVGTFPRIVAIRRADNAGEHRRFVHPQVGRQLIEVEPRRLIDTEDRFAAVVTEVDLVEVDLEDLVFRHAGVEQHRKDGLRELAPPRALLG